MPATVHPRACGEHEGDFDRLGNTSGSSPRMRGALRQVADKRHRHRFIPAHAGSTPPIRQRSARYSVHPRACGEHRPILLTMLLCLGSSPRMRGARRRITNMDRVRRFIPAHAGSTEVTQDGIFHGPVHPRACGEHSAAVSFARWFPGSSPRMRGALPYQFSDLLLRRFIPAHAGSTVRCADGRQDQAVHPRACGEHCTMTRPMRTVVGSSPRMRGALGSSFQIICNVRFIPAHAGSTAVESSIRR